MVGAVSVAKEQAASAELTDRNGMSAIARALANLQPEADGVDLAALAAAEERLYSYKQQREAPIADTPFTPALQSKAERRRLRQDGIEISQLYSGLGMACLDSSIGAAWETRTPSLPF